MDSYANLNSSIIIVSNDYNDIKRICGKLESSSLSSQIIIFNNAADTLQFVKSTPASEKIIICDYKLPDRSGFELFNDIKNIDSACPFILMFDPDTANIISDALINGIENYFIKDLNGSYIDFIPGILVSASKKKLYTIEKLYISKQLEIYQDKLEKLVFDRTSDLLRANDALREEIAERKKIEEELRTSKAKLQILFDYAPDPYYIGDSTGVIIDANKATEKLGGYKLEEFIGKNVFDLGVIPEFEKENLCNLLQKKDPSISTVDIIRKDGMPVTIEMRAYPMAVNQEQLLLITARDVTRQRKIEEDLRNALNTAETSKKAAEEINEDLIAAYRQLEIEKNKAEKTREASERYAEELKRAYESKKATEEASRAKSQFLANMSHEIRTPMNGIISLTDIVLDSELNSIQRRYLRMVKSSAESLLNIINDILDLSKIESKKESLQEEPFNLNEILSSTIDSLGIKAYEKKIELGYYVNPDVPVNLIGDPIRLRQILLNLIGNGLKFTFKGEVFCRIENFWTEGDLITIHGIVSDSGIGIPEEKMNLIFDVFAQADDSHSRKYGGTGLGLAIVKQIVEMMKGRVWVESKVDTGSTFHFTIDFKIDRENQKNDTLKPVLAGKKALIIDSKISTSKLLCEILSSYNMRCSIVESISEALEKFEEFAESDNKIDVIIANSPAYNKLFFDSTKYMSKLDKDLKIICLISPVFNVGSDSNYEGSGISSCLIKPIRQDRLLNTMASLFRPDIFSEPQENDINSENQTDPLKILIAEDNPINMTVAVTLIRKKGWEVTSCLNGIQVLDALRKDCYNYDLILMDLQMPEMDGFEATSLIRKEENNYGGHIPIIALTADAMKGVMEKCLEAGMDDYISKPITPQNLYSKIIDNTRRRKSEQPEKPPISNEDDKSQLNILDKEIALQRIDGDEALYQTVLESFIETLPKFVNKIEQAQKDEDCIIIKTQAHSLKGSSAIVGASRIHSVACSLEQISDKISASELINRLIDEIDIFKRFTANNVCEGDN